MKVNQGRLFFKVEMDQKPAGLTSYAGVPLFVETDAAFPQEPARGRVHPPRWSAPRLLLHDHGSSR